MSVVERVRRTLRRHDLLPADTTVLVAVSGGSDSVALLHVLLELQPSERFRLRGLAHVHHGLRGAEADRDAAFCRELADRVGLPVTIEHVDVQRAAQRGRSIEEAARDLRYEALERCGRRVGAEAIAVGHTLDDQAETVLLKLARGAGARGVGGIHPRRGRVVRPLLDCRRSELRDWLGHLGLGFVEDSSNADRGYARNRVRHDVLPALRRACGAGVDALLARAADVARVEDAFLTELAEAASAEVVARSGDATHLDLAALDRQPPALQRRIVLRALRQAGARQPGLDAVERVLGLVNDRAGVDLPGVRADRIGPRVVLQSRAAAAGRPGQPFRCALDVPGCVRLAEGGWELRAERAARCSTAPGTSAVLDAAALTGQLFVRSWLPGDWLRPLGVGGRKKVQDLFVDRKVPRAERGRLPLVVAADDRVIWVPGHALDEAYRVTAATDNVVVLTLTESGGPE